jgi:hypothetical protein
MLCSRLRTKKTQDEPTVDAPATPSEIESLNAGKAFMVAYGKIIYFDVFGVKHWTQYCLWDGKPGFTFQAQECTAYNDADHD